MNLHNHFEPPSCQHVLPIIAMQNQKPKGKLGALQGLQQNFTDLTGKAKDRSSSRSLLFLVLCVLSSLGVVFLSGNQTTE